MPEYMIPIKGTITICADNDIAASGALSSVMAAICEDAYNCGAANLELESSAKQLKKMPDLRNCNNCSTQIYVRASNNTAATRVALCGISGNEEIIANKNGCKNWSFRGPKNEA